MNSREDFSGIDIEAVLAAMAPPATPEKALAKAPKLEGRLAELDTLYTICIIAGLSTDPAYQRHGSRLDWAVRLLLSYARGGKKPMRAQLDRILNRDFEKARINALEDPIEDFFTEAVPTPEGDFLIFSGYWEKAASFTECIFEAFSGLPDGGPRDETLDHVFALLRLSDAMVKRAGLTRRIVGNDTHSKTIMLPPDARLKQFAGRVFFNMDDLAEIGVTPEQLKPFLLSEEQAETVALCPPGNSDLECRPLIQTADGILVAAPANISTAVRALLIGTAVPSGMRKSLCRGLLEAQTKLVEESGFVRIRGPVRAVGEVCLFREGCFEESAGRYIHIVQIADGFHDWPKTAFGDATEYPHLVGDELIKSIRSAKSHMETLDGYREGMTLVLLGGWGAPRILSYPRPPDLADWLIVTLEPADAAVMGECENGKVADIWRMQKQFRLVEKQGFNFVHTNGPLNLFQLWRDSDCAFVPPHLVDIKPPLAVNFDFNRLLTARQEGLEALDRRMVLHPDGQHRRVSRLDRRAIDDTLQPIYASMDTVRRGVLLGGVLEDDHAWWLSELGHGKGRDTSNDFETWKAALKWMARVLPSYREQYGAVAPPSIAMVLEICKGAKRADGPIPVLTDAEVDASVELSIDPVERRATVTLKAEWQWGLHRADNAAEVALATNLVLGAAALEGVTIAKNDAMQLVKEAAGSIDFRWRHLFEATEPVDRLAAQGLIPGFKEMPASAIGLAKCNSAWQVRDRSRGGKIKGKEDCVAFLTAYGAFLLETLCAEIRRFDKRSLIETSLVALQSALREQKSWKNTTRALRAILGVERDTKVSFERVSAANAVIRGATIVTEIAAAEAQDTGGLTAGRMDLEECAARAVLYFETMDMLAAMYGDRVDPELEISPTGDVRHDHAFERQALMPTAERRHVRERDDAAEDYVSRFEKQDSVGKITADFTHAFETEYGVDTGTYMNLSYESGILAGNQQTGVLVLSRSALIAMLDSCGRETVKNVTPLIDRWTLPSRTSWQERLAGQKDSDFDLAKFDRRCSLIGRPIIALDRSEDPLLVVAPAVVERACHHNMFGAYAGTLQNEFWTSKAMQTYASRRGAQAGLEFNDKVAKDIEALGLKAWPSRPLSWCLNQKATDALKAFGDVDVLAVSPDGKIVWVTEVKDLKLCRTRGEAARRLSGYRGKLTSKGKPDDLLRHLRRVEYLRKNVEQLRQRLGLAAGPIKVCGLVIARAPQPMEQFQVKGNDGRVVMLADIANVPWSRGWKKTSVKS